MPRRPPHFVPRPEVLEELKRRLFADGKPGALVITAIQAMGGVGKSTIAAVLAREPDVRRRFPDGVLWATLGQEPDVLSVLSVWVRALGDYEFTRYGTDAAANYLRTLLEPKAALVVIDDAWNQADVASLLVGGPRMPSADNDPGTRNRQSPSGRSLRARRADDLDRPCSSSRSYYVAS